MSSPSGSDVVNGNVSVPPSLTDDGGFVSTSVGPASFAGPTLTGSVASTASASPVFGMRTLTLTVALPVPANVMDAEAVVPLVIVAATPVTDHWYTGVPPPGIVAFDVYVRATPARVLLTPAIVPAVGAAVRSYAPMSHVVPWGRATPRWSTVAHVATPASIAGEPAWSARVFVGPPLLARAASPGLFVEIVPGQSLPTSSMVPAPV